MKKYLLWFFLSASSWAFLPPTISIIRDVFESRKPASAVELVFRHQVKTSGQDNTILEERVLYLGRKAHLYFRLADGQSMSVVLDRNRYSWQGGELPSRSQVFLKYWGSGNPDEFRDVLLGERFLRRDQLQQFKAGFEATGDPASWNLKENYIRHDGVYFSRQKGGISIAVEGEADRTVYFDKALSILKRIEWREGSSVASWDFSAPKKSADGTFPTFFGFSRDSVEWVNSQLASRHTLTERGVAEWFKGYSRSPASSSVEAAMRVVLSYR